MQQSTFVIGKCVKLCSTLNLLQFGFLACSTDKRISFSITLLCISYLFITCVPIRSLGLQIWHF